jgi:hypothetical protein
MDETMIEWTAEKIAQLKTVEEVKSLRDNAAKRGIVKLVDLCEADLRLRKPPQVRRARPEDVEELRTGQYVSEFHFVCPNESEVTKNQDGSIRTGTWVVAAANAEAAVKYGSLVALHVTKAEQSYVQGTVKAWTKQPREPKNAEGELVKTEFGIEFLIEPTNNTLPWKGDGAGEKGYAWAPIPEAK